MNFVLEYAKGEIIEGHYTQSGKGKGKSGSDRFKSGKAQKAGGKNPPVVTDANIGTWHAHALGPINTTHARQNPYCLAPLPPWTYQKSI